MLKRIALILVVTLVFVTFVSCSGDTDEPSDSGVVSGSEGWVFSDSGNSGDGETEYLSGDSLSNMYRMLSRKKTALYNNGAVLIVAVVPLSQTLYGEHLPDGYQNTVSELRFGVSDYIEQNNTSSVIYVDATAAMEKAKQDGAELYDKSGKLLPGGAFCVYGEIMKALPASLAGSVSAIEPDTVSGRYEIARTQNRISTFMAAAHRADMRSTPSLMVQYGDANLRDALEPYISSTFGSVGYVNGWNFNESDLSAYSPNIVLQLIGEDMIHTLFDSSASDTYSAGIRVGDDPYTTMTPIMLDIAMTAKNVACIMGTVEAGSEIKVSGENFETYIEYPQDERFFIDIKIPKDGYETVTLTAKIEGKAESSPLEVYCEYNVRAATRDVFSGKLSQLHYPYTVDDYRGSNLFSENELRAIEKGIESRLSRVRQYSGVDTKLVYLIAPNTMTIYPETATDEMAASKVSDSSRQAQVVELIKKMNNDSVLMVDLPEYMRSKKDLGKLYYQTDTHWNTLGGYFGYYKLMEVLHGNFGGDALIPYELDNFNVYKKVSGCGDLYSFLGVGNGAVTENVTYCSAKGQLLAKASTDQFNSDIRTTGIEGLPRGVVTRDSFGAALIPYVSEHFEKIVWMAPGQQVIKEILEDTKPDYYIQVLVERNTGALLGG